MHRIHLDAWLSKLDDDLEEGLGKDPLYLAHVRELLAVSVVADNPIDASWLRLELQDLERHHGVRLRDASAG